MTQATIRAIVNAHETTEGAGFPIRRPFPTQELDMVDPFLMLDHIGPVNWAPGEALGAPDHPHRGFETISYVLAGHKVHRDSHGGHGVLGPGDVQWMTAGSGIVHSELPAPAFKASGGLSHGFQIWVNLPAREKMCTPRYQDVRAESIPEVRSPDGLGKVKIIAGESQGITAAIETKTPVTYLHFTLQPGAAFEQAIPRGQSAMIYVFAGELEIGSGSERVIEGQLALLDHATTVSLGASSAGECLLLCGEPLRESVARMGPFVMNTRSEIEQAVADYRAGHMGVISQPTPTQSGNARIRS